MPLVYATETDLAGWSGEPAPDNAVQLLRHASVLVRGATVRAIYATTPAGLPSDDDVAEAFRDATCAQAASWAAQGIDPAQPHAGPRVEQSKSLGSRSVTYADSDAVIGSRYDAARTLCTEALDILTTAGLTGGRLWTTG